MKKILLLTLSCVVGGIIIGLSFNASAQESSSIPSWIKNNAKWWSEGSIDDSTFISGIQYMIQNGIIQVSSTPSGSTTSQQIPSWVKNNAKWWAEGQLSDDDFIKAIQWLVDNGLIQSSTAQQSISQSTTSTNTSSNNPPATTTNPTPPKTAVHNQLASTYASRMKQYQNEPSTQPMIPLSANIPLSAKLPTAQDVAPYGYQLKGQPTNSGGFDENGAADSIRQVYVKTSVSPQTRIIISIATYGDALTTLKEHDAIYAMLGRAGYETTIRSSYAFSSWDGSKVFCSTKGQSGLDEDSVMYDFCVSNNTLYLFQLEVNWSADSKASSDSTAIQANFFHVDKSLILG